jgi:hypothetical protein
MSATDKRIALKDLIEIDNVDLSNNARSIAFTSEDERIDASGFNTTGASEFLAGTRVREVTIEFIMTRGSAGVHQTLYRLHDARVEFDFSWRADGSASISSTNPELRGTVILPSYSEGATRGELEVASLTFVASRATDPLTFYAT